MVMKLARMAAILMWVLPGWAYALGLGDIELNSYLNDKLDARIELLGVTPEEIGGLSVTLASPADYVRAGLEFSPSLRLLQFAPVAPAAGKSYIKVFTKESFREPFLNFLIEVNWGKGRVIREYTLLIDPPTLVAAPPVVTEAAVSKPVQTQSRVEAPAAAPEPAATMTDSAETGLFPRIPIETETAAAGSETVAVQASRGSGQEITTRRNDTLWGIANRVRPDKAVSVEQTMLGIYRQNPEAFQGNNINRLKAGYVIKVPGREVMTSVSTREARAESARQYREWKALRTQARRPEEAVAPEPEPPVEALPEGRLEILAPRTTDGVGEGVTTGQGGASPQDAPVADAQPQDNVVLRSRVSELEDEIQNMQRMAAIRDQELAALQQKLAEIQTGEPAPQVQAPQVEPDEDVSAEEPEAAKPAVKPVPAPVAKSEPKAEPPRPADDLLTTVKGYVEENPMMVGVAGGISLLVIVLLLMLVRQRKHAADGGEFDESILRDRKPVVPVAPEQDKEEPAAAVAEALVEETASESATQDKPKSSYLSDFAVSSMGNLHETSEADPLTEADVFLAYGRFQPAEAMIREAIENEPERMDLKLKLMEIFYAAKDQENFEREAQSLHNSMGDVVDPVWDKVVDMGKDLCPASSLFGGALVSEAPVSEAPVSEAKGDMALDFETTAFNRESESSAPARVVEAGKGGNLIDFDLDSFADTEIEAGKSAEGESGLEGEDMGLDFDLSTMGSGTDMDASVESVEAMEEVAQSLDEDDTNEVAEQLASELEDLASSMDTESPADAEPELKAEDDVLDFSFDTVESDAMEMDDLGEFTLDDADLALSDEDEDSAATDETDMPDSDDEVGTKLDLARAYIDMGDPDGARGILDEVLEEGNEQQKNEARELQGQLS